MTPSLALAIVLAVAAGLLSLWLLAALQREREARARLASSEGRFRQLVEAAADVIFRTDAEGRFSYANPAAKEALGRAEGELLGRPFLDVVRPDYREEARRFYADQRAQGIPNTYCEFPMVTGVGEDLWVGQRVQLLTEDGRFAGLQAVARLKRSTKATVRKKF